MDWEQIEKDYKKWVSEPHQITGLMTFNWFKQRIESELPPPPLNEEEKSEFHTTSLTADIKVTYGK